MSETLQCLTDYTINRAAAVKVKEPMDTLAHDSIQPLYHQIFLIVRGKILRGEYMAGDLLPAEPELMAQFQVSRTTVRLALDKLVNEGLIYRQRGRGTFVSAPRIEQDLNQGIRFTESLRQRELNASTQLLDAKMVPASDQTTIDLDVEMDEPLAIITRLRLVNQEPVGVQSSCLVHRLCPGILQHNFTDNSLYDVLEQEYGIRLARFKQTVRAVPPSPSMARELSVPAGLPLLYIERIGYNENGTPIELLRAHYRSDRYALHSEFER